MKIPKTEKGNFGEREIRECGVHKVGQMDVKLPLGYGRV